METTIDFENSKLQSMTKVFYGKHIQDNKEYNFVITADWNDWDDWRLDTIDWDGETPYEDKRNFYMYHKEWDTHPLTLLENKIGEDFLSKMNP